MSILNGVETNVNELLLLLLIHSFIWKFTQNKEEKRNGIAYFTNCLITHTNSRMTPTRKQTNFRWSLRHRTLLV